MDPVRRAPAGADGTTSTAAVREGRNALAVVLADGWFRGQTGITRVGRPVGQPARAPGAAAAHPRRRLGHRRRHGPRLAQLGGARRRGRPHRRASGGTSNRLPLRLGRARFRRRRLGRRRRRRPRLRRPGRLPGAAGAPGGGDRPASRSRGSTDGAQIVDLGQNINGWMRLTDLGPAGTTITLTHGEWLGPDGDVTTDHLAPGPAVPARSRCPAGQVDSVVSRGVPGDVFEPRRTTHGFQYVRIEGHPGELTVDDVRGVVVHTDMRRTGWFTCSDERVNRLHEAAVWSFRGQRLRRPDRLPAPRAGRRGPATGSCSCPPPPSSTTSPASRPSGCATSPSTSGPTGRSRTSAPAPRGEGRESPIAILNGSAGWGDAAVIVPWEIYRAYGDVQVLDELWPTMVALARPHRADGPRAAAPGPGRSAGPWPAPHEQYLWDTGFHWGEWLVPGEEIGADLRALVAADKGDVATAYFAHSARLMARIAEVLGRTEDAARYAELSVHVRDAWQAEYLDADGRLTPDTQANHVRALAFDLVPGRAPAGGRRAAGRADPEGRHPPGHRLPRDAVPAARARRHRSPRRRLRAAAPGQRAVVAGHGRPRRDDGVGARGTASPPTACRTSRSTTTPRARSSRSCTGTRQGSSCSSPRTGGSAIRPVPGGGLTSAEAAHESPYGRIESAWRIDGDAFELRVVVPAGTEAEVVLPDGTHRHRRSRRAHLHEHDGGPAMTAETTEWAGPARYLPPPEPVRRDDGALHYVGATYAAPGGLPPAAAGPLRAERGRAAPARRLDPRRRLDDGRPALPARDAAARTRCSTSCSPRGSPSPRSTTGTPSRPSSRPSCTTRRRRSAGCGPTPTTSASRPTRIGVMGESAGGHLAALVGLTAHRADLEGPHGVVGPSSAVDVVVDWYGPADFTTMPRMTPPPHIAAKLEPAMLTPPEDQLDPGARGAGPRRRQPDHPRDAAGPAVPAGARHHRLAGALRAERAARRGADRGRRAGPARPRRGRRAHLHRAATTSTPSSSSRSTTWPHSWRTLR